MDPTSIIAALVAGVALGGFAGAMMVRSRASATRAALEERLDARDQQIGDLLDRGAKRGDELDELRGQLGASSSQLAEARARLAAEHDKVQLLQTVRKS